MRFALLLIGCASSHHAVGPPAPQICATKQPVRVVDEQGAPVVGAKVRAVTNYWMCGPSGLPEGCGAPQAESPDAMTDVTGTAMVCAADRLDRRMRGARITVEYRDWPRAMVDAEQLQRVVIGPGHETIAEVPCSTSVRVVAQSELGAEPIYGTPIPGGLRTQRYRLANLGPWRYWVRSNDDSCGSFVRIVDGERRVVLDGSDSLIEFPAFAGGAATVTKFRETAPIATATLDDSGRAKIALPDASGSAYCLRIVKGDQCVVTFARAGEIARAELYRGRDADIAASCGRCP